MSKQIVKAPDKLINGAGGMVRSSVEGKVDYSLALDGPMFARLAEHLTKAMEHYPKRNWLRASTECDPVKRAESRDRFRTSVVRHFYQWFTGDTSEDHAAAMIFNLNGYEMMAEDNSGE